MYASILFCFPFFTLYGNFELTFLVLQGAPCFYDSYRGKASYEGVRQRQEPAGQG